MNLVARKIGLVFILLLCGSNVLPQYIFEQDIIQGGITAAGFSTGQGFGSGSFDIYIEPGSTIKKAYIFSYSLVSPPIVNFILNNNGYIFDTTNVIMNVTHTNQWASPVKLYYKDVTLNISPEITNYNVTIPSQFDLEINEGYWTIFLVVVYENPTLVYTNYSILINDKDLTGNEDYVSTNLNPFNTNYPVCFSIYTDRSGLIVGPQFSKEVYFNSVQLGIVGGADNVNINMGNGSGVKGHFYYQNNQLFGLDDDTPDVVMTLSDGLADVSQYLTNNSTSCSFQLKHVNYPNHGINNSSVNLAYFLAYSTPCQPFETTLTDEVTLCRGDSAQLLATGGTSTGSVPGYEWQPQEDLTCYDCPNPVFFGDSTRHYTVRIWNTDSCSKVLPVKVLVYDVPTQANLNINPATCSESNGSMSVNNVVGGTAQYIYNIGGNNSSNPNFNNLAPGVYNLQITDANTCNYNQAFTIEEINPVTAAFIANPQQGVAPLNVNFTNQSTGANLYQWLVNTQTFESFNLNYTFDTAGTYPVQLIATYNEPQCADTAQKVIVVENDFSVIIPTLFHSTQGSWGITTSNVVQIKAQVYNAIGQLIHQSQQTANNGPNLIWPADENATGYYFYRLQLTDVDGKEHEYEGKVLVVN
jgi:PKD repeat protein